MSRKQVTWISHFFTCVVLNWMRDVGDTMGDQSGSRSGGGGTSPDGASRLRRVKVEDLMAGSKEIVLEFEQQDYRLRITSKGKLILTK